MDKTDMTVAFSPVREDAEQVIKRVYEALVAKGYDPLNQLVGYIISGDPTYITSYNNARALIRRIERDELLEELISFYLKNKLG